MASQTATVTADPDLDQDAIALHQRVPRHSLPPHSPSRPPSTPTAQPTPFNEPTSTSTPSSSAPHPLKPLSISYAFFCAGINDGSLGPLIPYLLRTYSIQTSFVSIVYGVTFAGWVLAAVSNSFLTQRLRLGALLLLGALLQLAAHALRAWGPPFPLFAVSFGVASLGQAFEDAHGNAFVSGLGVDGEKGSAHRWLGFVHAMYMAGCLVGPLVATAVAAATAAPAEDSMVKGRWSLFYFFPLALCVGNAALITWAFWGEVGIKRSPSVGEGVMEEGVVAGEEGIGRKRAGGTRRAALQEMRNTLRLPSVWLLSLFFFFFLGAAITAGGWAVSFLIDTRGGSLDRTGYVAAGYSGGGFLGRLLLAEPTHRFGERRMVLLYVGLALAMQLCFWLIPNIVADAVAVSLLGFFSGPLFATGVSVGSKLFPAHVRSSALALVFVLGQIGGSIFPAITGLIATSVGVGVLQPVLVALIAATGVSWVVLPKVPKSEALAPREGIE